MADICEDGFFQISESGKDLPDAESDGHGGVEAEKLRNHMGWMRVIYI